MMGTLSTYAGNVLTLAESLRSGVAKNALICLQDLFGAFKRQLDSTLENVIPVVLKKAADTNIFLSSEAEKTLEIVCRNANENKIAMYTMNQIKATKNQHLKARGALALRLLCAHLGAGIAKLKEFPAILKCVVQLTSEASPDCRSVAREAVSTLLRGFGSVQEVEKHSRKYLSDQEQSRLRSIMDKL